MVDGISGEACLGVGVAAWCGVEVGVGEVGVSDMDKILGWGRMGMLLVLSDTREWPTARVVTGAIIAVPRIAAIFLTDTVFKECTCL